MKNKHKKAYMKCAWAFAECSPALRLKVGAVLVKNNRIISCGYNALPEHLDGPCEHEGVTRQEVRHAEKNALLGLTKSSLSSEDAIMFVTHSCCLPCAIDIVDSGIKEVYYCHEYRDTAGLYHLVKNGVKVFKMKGCYASV